MSPLLPGIIASGISGHLTPPFSAIGAYDALATVTLSSAASAITFANIPSGYKHLQIRALGRTTRTEYVLEDANMQMNGDTSANYSWHRLYSNPGVGTSTLVSNASANATYINSVAIFGTNGANSGVFGASVIDVLDYSSTTKYKVVRSLTGLDTNNQELMSVIGFAELSSGAWLSSEPVTSLSFTSTTGTQFTANTQFALYGVK
jgi:hypothetical protein